jgi:hypothetical protein
VKSAEDCFSVRKSTFFVGVLRCLAEQGFTACSLTTVFG